MEDLWAHPITVATYTAAIALAVAGARSLIRLFQRMGHVEESIKRLEHDLGNLTDVMVEHIAEEMQASERHTNELREMKTMIKELRT